MPKNVFLFQFSTILGAQKHIKGQFFAKNDYIDYFLQFQATYFTIQICSNFGSFYGIILQSLQILVWGPFKNDPPWPPEGCRQKFFFEKNARNNILGKVDENGDNLNAYKHTTYRKP